MTSSRDLRSSSPISTFRSRRMRLFMRKLRRKVGVDRIGSRPFGATDGSLPNLSVEADDGQAEDEHRGAERGNVRGGRPEGGRAPPRGRAHARPHQVRAALLPAHLPLLSGNGECEKRGAAPAAPRVFYQSITSPAGSPGPFAGTID